MTTEQIITIIGWFVLAFLQLIILQRQARNEKIRQAKDFLIPRKFKVLSDIQTWITEGFELYIDLFGLSTVVASAEINKKISDVKSAMFEWTLQATFYSALLKQIDQKESCHTMFTNYHNDIFDISYDSSGIEEQFNSNSDPIFNGYVELLQKLEDLAEDISLR